MSVQNILWKLWPVYSLAKLWHPLPTAFSLEIILVPMPRKSQVASSHTYKNSKTGQEPCITPKDTACTDLLVQGFNNCPE